MTTHWCWGLVVMVAAGSAGCQVDPGGAVRSSSFVDDDGRSVRLWTVTSDSGLAASIAETDASLVALQLPTGTTGQLNVIASPGDLHATGRPGQAFGSIAGRVPDDLAGTVVELQGETWTISAAPAEGSWRGSPGGTDQGRGVRPRRIFADGTQGLPGTVSAEIEYVLTPARELVVTSRAAVTAPTLVDIHPVLRWDLSPDSPVTTDGQRVTVGAAAPRQELVPGVARSVVEGPVTDRPRRACVLETLHHGPRMEVWTTAPYLEREVGPAPARGVRLRPSRTGTNHVHQWRIHPGESGEEITTYRFDWPVATSIGSTGGD